MVDTFNTTVKQMHEREIAEMQKQNHYLMIRVKDLNEEVERLKKQLEELKEKDANV